MRGANKVDIVEVGTRDGFQSVADFIPTEVKVDIIRKLHETGIRRAEITSFVSERALPQLADAAEVVAASAELPGLDAQVLVPTARHATRALEAGATHLSAVLSVSESHNRGNVRRTPIESAADYADIASSLPKGAKVRLNLATAFDCPHEGQTPESSLLLLLDRLVLATSDVEIALCDTTGRANPSQVTERFAAVRSRYPEVRGWAFHGHDTYGLGAANVLAAWNAGITVFDASVAGLGGCPYAPGATGNVATEDLVWMFGEMGVETGIKLDDLADVAQIVAGRPGAQIGGRVRQALSARACQAGAE